MSIPELTIFIQRDGRIEHDDIVRVRRVEDRFVVVYRDGESHTRVVHTFDREGMRGYFYTLVVMLTHDIEPFKVLQVCGVGFPSIAYSIGDIEPGTRAWSTILVTLNSYVDGQWATRPRVVAPVGTPTNTTRTDDEDIALEGLRSLRRSVLPSDLQG